MENTEVTLKHSGFINDENYYKPEIEEFHYGFEFQMQKILEQFIYDPVTGELLNDPLVECVDLKVNSSFSLGEITNRVYRVGENHYDECIGESIRVRKLNKEDIEFLGFVLEAKKRDMFLQAEEETCVYFNEELNLILNHNESSGTIGMITIDPSKDVIFATSNIDPNKISRLKIKNKFELIKLLKQNVNNN